MQAKELETLDHVSFHPRLQFTKARFSSFVEDSFSIFCEASLLSSAMLHELVMTSQAYVAQLTGDGRAGDGSAHVIEASRLCNAAGIIMHGQALRC